MSIFHGERDLSRRFSASILAATVTDQHSQIDKPEPRWQALLAFLDGEPAGFALFHPRFSTWLGRPGVYLEDLFVTQAARGKGVGRRLMIRLAAIAVERGWERIDFQVLDWNPARGFYRRRSAGNPRLPISPRWATRVAAPRKPDRLRQR